MSPKSRFIKPSPKWRRRRKEALTAHREQTHGHVERLEEVFEMMGKRSQTKPCEAIRGIISEGEETIEDFGQSPAIDAGLVAAGQAVGALRDGALRGSDRLGEAIEYAQSSGSPRRNCRRKGVQVADPNRCYQGRREGRPAEIMTNAPSPQVSNFCSAFQAMQ